MGKRTECQASGRFRPELVAAAQDLSHSCERNLFSFGSEEVRRSMLWQRESAAAIRPLEAGGAIAPRTRIGPELQPTLAMARTLCREELPAFLGGLEEIRVTAFARLTEIAPAANPDELVDISEASRRLGVSKSYLYRHSGQFPFAHHIGRKLVFSSLGIDRYIATRR